MNGDKTSTSRVAFKRICEIDVISQEILLQSFHLTSHKRQHTFTRQTSGGAIVDIYNTRQLHDQDQKRHSVINIHIRPDFPKTIVIERLFELATGLFYCRIPFRNIFGVVRSDCHLDAIQDTRSCVNGLSKSDRRDKFCSELTFILFCKPTQFCLLYIAILGADLSLNCAPRNYRSPNRRYRADQASNETQPLLIHAVFQYRCDGGNVVRSPESRDSHNVKNNERQPQGEIVSFHFDNVPRLPPFVEWVT